MVKLAAWEESILVEQWWGQAGGAPLAHEPPYRQARIWQVWRRHVAGGDGG